MVLLFCLQWIQASGVKFAKEKKKKKRGSERRRRVVCQKAYTKGSPHFTFSSSVLPCLNAAANHLHSLQKSNLLHFCNPKRRKVNRNTYIVMC
ncbi:hypothetical protein ERO13_1Z049505v2 [Gossypium hirsutum]|nr:hypothetical protein ERO13_1Z049505v2 [Gossypium hirsutum]